MRQRLKLSAKLTLPVGLATVPPALFAGLWLHQQWGLVTSIRNEWSGTRAAMLLLDLAARTQHLHGLRLPSLSGQALAQEATRVGTDQMARTLGSVVAAPAGQPQWQLTTETEALRGTITPLANQPGSDVRAVNAGHLQVIGRINVLLQRLGSVSQPLLDVHGERYFLVELTIDRLLPWSESADQLRSDGSAMLTGRAAGPADVLAAQGRVAVLERQLDALAGKLDEFKRAGGKVPELQASAETLTRGFIQRARTVLGGTGAARSAAPATAWVNCSTTCSAWPRRRVTWPRRPASGPQRGRPSPNRCG